MLKNVCCVILCTNSRGLNSIRTYFSLTDNSDLLAVTVVNRDGGKQRRFLVVDVYQIVLVEPDATRLGWGVATFVGFLQDLEVVTDKVGS